MFLNPPMVNVVDDDVDLFKKEMESTMVLTRKFCNNFFTNLMKMISHSDFCMFVDDFLLFFFCVDTPATFCSRNYLNNDIVKSNYLSNLILLMIFAMVRKVVGSNHWPRRTKDIKSGT